MLGPDRTQYTTQSKHRTQTTLVYLWIKNLRAVQLSLRHSRRESTVPNLGVELRDALEIP